MFKTTYNPYVCDIAITQNQEKFLVDQVISQLTKFYSGKDNRRMVLNAFTGSGKTTVALKVLIPKFVKKFTSKGKRVIAFMAPRAEVVEQSYVRAKKALNNKIVSGSVIKCYNSSDINNIKKEVINEENVSLDGDVIVLFLTAQYFGQNFAFLTKHGIFDLVIVDEAHIMFGTISKEDTKADKGVTNNNFEAHTLDKLRQLSDTAVLFLTATPTNSQQEKTFLGQANNVFLKPMPRDVLTTPFFDIVPYIDSEDTVEMGLEYFRSQCEKIGSVISSITDDTWNKAEQFKPMYPAVLIRLARRGSTNGADFEKKIHQISDYCDTHNFRLLLNTSESYNDDFYAKQFNGQKIASLAEGVMKAEKADDRPVVIVTIESGYAGLDLQKINNVIIGREPSGTIHNNYSQTGGRAARMKQGFINHADAVAAINFADIDEDQKRLLAEYYILHSTSVVHVPVDSKLLNGDVKKFIETDTWREQEGRAYVLNNVFGKNHPSLLIGPHLVNSSSIQDEAYKKYKKIYCEACKVSETDGNTYCFHSAWEGFQNLINAPITLQEMEILWPMCLHVHHLDGNHFNNEVDNLKTICPNVHSLVTMYNEDYKNRYTELRAALTKIANKKGVPINGVLAFKLF